MKNTTKKIAGVASVATLLLSINSVALAEPAQPTTSIDLRTTTVSAPNPVTAESKLFIGLIKEIGEDKVLVEKLFDIDSNIEDNSSVYINIIDFKDKVKYIEGYLISVHYNEINKGSNGYIITPISQPTVEENKEVSICEIPETVAPDKGTFGIGEFEQNQINKINQQMKEEGSYFCGKIISSDNGKIVVDPLFNVEDNLTKRDQIIIDINSAEFPNDTVESYPEGYLISVYYEHVNKDKEQIEVIAKTVSAVEEDKIATISTISEDQGSFFRGKVISQDGDKVIVEPFFDLDTQFSKDDKVYITLTNDELKENQTKVVKKDQVITVYYSGLNKHGDETEIVAESFTSIDEDQMNMFTSSENKGQGQIQITQVINDNNSDPVVTHTKVEVEKEQKTGFFSSIGRFFKGIFSAIGNLF